MPRSADQDPPAPPALLDRDAFEERWRQHQDAVYRYLVSALRGDRDRADDEFQEIFLHAYEHYSSYDPGRPFPKWLFTVVRHKHIDIQRRDRAYRERLKCFLEATDTRAGHNCPDPDSSIGTEKRITQLKECVGNERQWAAFFLSEVDGLTDNEIASLLATTPNNVKQLRHKARAKIKEYMREHNGDVDV